MAQSRPDYSFKNELPLGSVMDLLANKRLKEEQIANYHQQRQQSALAGIHQTVQDATSLVQNMVNSSRTRQEMEARRVLGQVLQEPDKSAVVGSRTVQNGTPATVPTPEGLGGPNAGPTMSVMNMPEGATQTESQVPVTYGDTPMGRSQDKRKMAAILAGFPDAAGKDISAETFPKPNANPYDIKPVQNPDGTLSYTYIPKNPGMSGGAISSGVNIPDRPDKAQSKYFMYDGNPIATDFDPVKRIYYRSGTNEVLDGSKLQPMAAQSSPLAEIRRDALLDKMKKDLPKSLQPALWSPSTVAGRAANIVSNADSYLGQADNVLKGHVIPDRQVMTTLGIDAARTLTQAGVVSEKTINDLVAQSAGGKIADWQSWLLDSPQGRPQQDFIKNLSTEVRRQRDQKQAIIDRTMGSNLASHDQLRKMDPDAWKGGLESLGIDVDAAKKGHLKLLPEVQSMFYGSKEIPGVTNSAEETGDPEFDAAMKARGLR